MNIFHWKFFTQTTFFLCLFTTIMLSIHSLYRYSDDKDVTLVESIKFHSSKDAIYPSLSLCITKHLFLSNQFAQYGDDAINEKRYAQFLMGSIWDEKLLRVDYDNVTVSLADNLIFSYYVKQDWNWQRLTNPKLKWTPKYYISFRSHREKCFTILTPYLELEQLYFLKLIVSNGIFPYGRCEYCLKTYFHYPGQRLISYHIKREEWKRKSIRENYEMYFYIKNQNVITRRSKSGQPCYENWKNHDQYVMNEIMNEAGCRPPHWGTILNLPLCSNTTSMSIFSEISPAKFDSFKPPCKSIDQLDFSYKEIRRPRFV